MSRRRNGEGSIYPVPGGYRGYVWCTSPGGERYRKYVKGKTYEAARRAWFKLRDEAGHGPVSSDVPKLSDFLSYWLKEIVQPNLAPKTYQTYELFVRLHIVPHLGYRRLDQLQVKDIRQWINKLTRTCQCCAQGKDAARSAPKRRCCAVGKCCRETLSPQSRKDARATLRAALTCAVEEEIITRNPVGVIRLPAPRKSKGRVWTVDEARRFLESARHDCDPLYAAYVLILVLGLRKGEVLGLTWDRVDLDAAELYVGE
jgi:integrase